jgi:hypothetical protein
VTDADQPATAPPVLRVVRGDATPAELAALVTVLAARAAGAASAAGADTAQADEPPRRSAWSDPSRSLRQPLSPGPGAWRAAALPR